MVTLLKSYLYKHTWTPGNLKQYMDTGVWTTHQDTSPYSKDFVVSQTQPAKCRPGPSDDYDDAIIQSIAATFFGRRHCLSCLTVEPQLKASFDKPHQRTTQINCQLKMCTRKVSTKYSPYWVIFSFFCDLRLANICFHDYCDC